MARPAMRKINGFWCWSGTPNVACVGSRWPRWHRAGWDVALLLKLSRRTSVTAMHRLFIADAPGANGFSYGGRAPTSAHLLVCFVALSLHCFTRLRPDLLSCTLLRTECARIAVVKADHAGHEQKCDKTEEREHCANPTNSTVWAAN